MKKKLQVILKKDVEGLGIFGETKKVAAGFARNYLIPNGFVLYLKDPRSKEILKQKEQIDKEREKEKEKIQKLAQKLLGAVLEFKVRANEKGKLFASVDSDEVVAKLNKEFKIKLDKKQIQMQPLKEAGEREVVVKLGYNVDAKIIVKVEAEKKQKSKK